jgi:WD40 repeat protein
LLPFLSNVVAFGGGANDPAPPAPARLGKKQQVLKDNVSTGVTFSPDSRRIAWVTTVAQAAPNCTVTVHVWDTATRKQVCLCEFTDDTASATAGVVFAPDGKSLAVATYHESGGPAKSTRFGHAQVRLFDADKGKEMPGFDSQRASIDGGFCAIAFAPDGKSLTTVREFSVQVWDTSKGKLASEFEFASEDDGGGVSYEILSPDGKCFAAALGNDPVRFWDVATGKKLGEIKDAGSPLAFSPDGKVLVTAGEKQIRLWSVAKAKELGQVKGEADPIALAAFSADGKLLAWTAKDQSVHVAEVSTGKELRAYKAEGGPVAFSPNGKTLASLCPDGTVLLWEAPVPAK